MERPPRWQVSDLVVTAKLSARRERTDRNRTTPFAFTGNKFEFRAVGSSANCAWPMTILNAAVADSCRVLRERILAKQGPRDKAVLEIVREVFQETRRVCFEGNNYSQEWIDEAAKRGLSNHKTTPAALAVLSDPNRTAPLMELGILRGHEIEARHEIWNERYTKELQIESSCLIELATLFVAPAAQQQIARSGGAHAAAKAASAPTATLESEIQALAARYNALDEAVSALRRVSAEVEHDAHGTAEKLRPAMAEVRRETDALEQLVADDLWPLPKYREMLLCGV